MLCQTTRGLAAAAVVTLAASTGGLAHGASFVKFGSEFANVTTTNLTPSQSFGTEFSGSLGFSANAETHYVGALLDGAFTGNPNSFGFEGLTGKLDFESGNITGGYIKFAVGDGLATDTFYADFAPNTHAIVHAAAGDGYTIAGDLKNIIFSGPSFAGFDVSAFFGGSYGGSFFGFNYNGQTIDPNSSIIATAVIPLPGAVWMGLLGLGGVMFARHRCRR